MAELFKKKIDIGNRECLNCEKPLDLGLEKSYLKIEGDYCKKMPIVSLDGRSMKRFLIYANICLDCFRKTNESPQAVMRFKEKWNSRVDKFKDRLY